MDLLDLVDDIEFSFINLLKQDFPQGVFEKSATNMFGSDKSWKEDGRELVTQHAPEMLEQFEKYAGKEDDKEWLNPVFDDEPEDAEE